MTAAMTAALQLRHATVDDVARIVALVESVYRGDSSRAGWTSEADLLDGQRTDAADVRSCIAQARSAILVAEEGGVLRASAHVADEDGAGYFGMFAVDVAVQRRGVGKLVLDAAEALVRDAWALPVMRMTVIDVRAELIAYYERRGYRRTGIKKPFPYGDPRFGLPRRADLQFEVLEKPL